MPLIGQEIYANVLFTSIYSVMISRKATTMTFLSCWREGPLCVSQVLTGE